MSREVYVKLALREIHVNMFTGIASKIVPYKIQVIDAPRFHVYFVSRNFVQKFLFQVYSHKLINCKICLASVV